MAVGRRLSKRRPKKEQPQTVQTQSWIEPAVGETAQDGSITQTPKHRVPPTKAELDKVANFCVEDADGNKIPFRRLYEEQPRVLLIFIRHFFCGNCQEFLRTLCSVFTRSTLSPLPLPTTLAIVGCGSPSLIPMYATETGCPFPIYSDPTKTLYAHFNMVQSLSLGKRHPDYMQESVPANSIRSFFQTLRAGREMLKGGSFSQNGGEFIFEKGECIWANRMQNTRDHAELADLQAVLKSGEERAPRREKWSSGIVRSLSNRARRQSWGPVVARRESSRNDKNAEKRASWNVTADKDGGAATAAAVAYNKRHSWGGLWIIGKGGMMPVNGKEPQRDSISLETPPMENLQEDDKGEADEESLAANSQNGHPAQAKDSNDDRQQEDEEEPPKNLTASDGDGHVADPDLEPESRTKCC